MKALLNNPWVVGALCIAALITVYLRLFDTKSRTSVPPPVAQPVAAVGPVEPQPAVTPVTVQSVDSSGDAGPIVGKWIDKVTRDPFQRMQDDNRRFSAEITPGDSSEGASPPSLSPDQPLRLHAIFVNGSNRIAVINSTFLKVGDRVAGFRVSQIKSDGVWLQGATDKQWLEFGQAQKQEQVS